MIPSFSASFEFLSHGMIAHVLAMIVLDADDTNANTYGTQQLTVFNAYHGESNVWQMVSFPEHNNIVASSFGISSGLSVAGSNGMKLFKSTANYDFSFQ